jgi:small GTP-binding protein
MSNSEFTNFTNNIDELEKNTSDCLVLSFVGEVSSGKSTAIKKLFDINPGDISAVPGSTKHIKYKFLKKNVLLLDTPGLGDVNTSISEITKRVLNLTDLFIVTLSAQGGLKETDKNSINQITSFNKPLLVLITKLDTISNRNERRELVRHTKRNLNELQSKSTQVFGVMLDVDDRFRAFEPILAEIEAASKVVILDWLSNQLQYNSKVLLLLKVSKNYRNKALDGIQSYISNLSCWTKKFAIFQDLNNHVKI